MKPVLKYPGSKTRLADWICGQIPKKHVYLELFFGGGSILFNKARSPIETINDLDGNVVNFFRVVRSYPEDLKRQLELTPYAREEYINAYTDTDDEVEQARRFCVRCWQGFGCGNLYQNGFKSGQQLKSPNPAKAWDELPEMIGVAAERLKGVQIECMPALELLTRYNSKDVFIYADPPYLPGIRKSHLYKYEMTVQDHVELLEALRKHPGKVMISGYDDPDKIYDSYLQGWRKAYKQTLAEGGRKRTEVLWMNYDDGQMTIADFPGVIA